MAAASDPRSVRRTGAWLMLGSAVGFSVMSLLVKVASRDLPAMQIVFARSVFMVAATGLLARHARVALSGVNRPTLLARGVVGATALSLLYWGLGRLPLGDATTVHYTAPVWTALSAAVLVGERLRASLLAGVGACLVGVVLIARPAFLGLSTSHALDPVALGAVFAAAILSGLAYTFVRKLRATDHPLTIIFWLSWVGVVASLPFALSGAWRWPTPGEAATLLGVGVATQAGQVALTHGLRRLEAGLATAIGYVQIVLAFGWGWLVFGEAPGRASLIGAAIVLSSVAALAGSAVRTAVTPSGPAADLRSPPRDADAG